MKYFLYKLIARFLAAPVLKLWFNSLKWEVVRDPENDGPVIFGFWHQDIFAVIGFLSNEASRKPMTALVSASPDGEILQLILDKLDFKVVQGSSSQNGFPALVGLNSALGSRSVLITPDGPKGPAKKLKQGIMHLARYSQKPVVLIRADCRSCWRLKSWDRFVIPRPFSRCRLVFSKPIPADRYFLEPDSPALKEMMEDTLNGCESRAAVEESVL